MSRQPYLSLNLNAGPSGRHPSAEQLAALIRTQIHGNHLPAGCRQPPVRVLAHQLGISKNTAQRAYDELVAQGLVENRRRVGLFLARPQENIRAVPRNIAAVPALKDFSSLLAYALPRKSKNQGVEKPLDLSGAVIDPELLPVERFSACMRSVLKDRKDRLARYPHPQGFLPLRQKIAQRLNRRGIPAHAEQIITTIGSQQCLDLVCRALASPKLAVENPTYHIGKCLFEMNGLKLCGLPLDPFTGVNLADWQRRLQRHRPALLYLTPNFHNPTGYSYSTRELDQIVEWSAEYGFGILEEDWGSDMLSFSEFKPSLRARGGDNVLYMNAFTKKLLPSLRLGYLVGNERTALALVNSKRVSVLGTPLILEAALFEYLDRGYYDVHLKQLQLELDRRYQHCLDLLRSLMPEQVRWTSPGGGPLLWLEIPRCVCLQALRTNLAEKQIYINALERAFLGKPHLHGIRLGYAALNTADMQRGLEQLAGEISRQM
jgi:DNA-binding transcriptional MocR family regulator